MRVRPSAIWVVVAILALLISARAGAATPAEVDEAILKAREYLIKAQNDDGNWELVPKLDPTGGDADTKGMQWGGLTSIATYAELAAGEDPKSPKLAKAIQLLKDGKLAGIYAIGLRCQVWLLLNDKKLKPILERDKQALTFGLHADGKRSGAPEYGFYGYRVDEGPKPNEWYDRSVSQYGVLGMWALEQAGLEVPMRYWQVTDMAWRRSQLRDGGWCYRSDDIASGSTAPMTAAGVATLFITQDYLQGISAECHGNVSNINIDAGLKWMDRHITAALTGGNYYGMYGIERIGVASGRKYFDTVNWYEQGADYLVKNQDDSGSWGGDVPNTCFGLLFLARGRAPVAMNKLEYNMIEKNGKATPGPWNQRPRDCANLSRWVGRNIENDLNWQIVNLKVGADDLHDAPILYISGNRELTFSDADITTLRAFAQQGGLILGNADCSNIPFAKSFEKLGTTLFPKCEFRDLPSSHVIFTGEQYSSSKWPMKPRVRGLSNGIRELMLLIPEADAARGWQSRGNEKTHEQLWQLGANIFLYSVDKKNLRVKGATYLVKEDSEIQTTQATTLARLQVGDNPDPEPAGWPRMAAILHNEKKVALTIKDVPCDAASLKGIKLAHFTGTTTFKLADTQRKVLKDFVDSGGTLIIDAAGGSTEFATAAEFELNAIFGAAPKALPPDSPIYTYPDAKIESFQYRAFTRRLLTGDTRSPRIKAITIKGRPAVFYSSEDLSAGIVGEPIDGVVGYEPGVATALMRNMVLFGAFGIPKKPTTLPTTMPTTLPTTLPTTKKSV